MWKSTHSSTCTKAHRLAKRVLHQGVLNLFRDPKEAAAYWRQIAFAALQEPDLPKDSGVISPLELECIVPEPDSIPVTLENYQYETGDMPVHELMSVCRIIRHRRPRVIFEIATFLGGTTIQLAANSDADVYTFDLPPAGHKDYVEPKVWDRDLDVYPREPGMRFKESRYAPRISQIFGDSQIYDFSPYYGKVDVVLVDGCHHYEYVRRDTENALKMKSASGIVLWHDYASYAPGVIKALDELSHAIPLARIAGTSLVIHL